MTDLPSEAEREGAAPDLAGRIRSKRMIFADEE
jgi:hypothetical protein